MLRQFFISSLFISILSASSFSFEGPIIITSAKLTAYNNTALFEGSVVAKSADMTMHADRMFLNYDKNTGSVTKIEARGNVRLIKGQKAITSNEAVYLVNENKVIFTGQPQVTEGEKVVTGGKMTYVIDKELFLVEDSKVLLKRSKRQ